MWKVKYNKYATELKLPKPWYISRPLKKNGFEYLHSDGITRISTEYGNNYTGYYASEEEATQFLAKYLEQKK